MPREGTERGRRFVAFCTAGVAICAKNIRIRRTRQAMGRSETPHGIAETPHGWAEASHGIVETSRGWAEASRGWAKGSLAAAGRRPPRGVRSPVSGRQRPDVRNARGEAGCPLRRDAIHRVSHRPDGPHHGKDTVAGRRPERVRRDESRLYVVDIPCGGIAPATLYHTARQATPSGSNFR